MPCCIYVLLCCLSFVIFCSLPPPLAFRSPVFHHCVQLPNVFFSSVSYPAVFPGSCWCSRVMQIQLLLPSLILPPAVPRPTLPRPATSSHRHRHRHLHLSHFTFSPSTKHEREGVRGWGRRHSLTPFFTLSIHLTNTYTFLLLLHPLLPPSHSSCPSKEAVREI